MHTQPHSRLTAIHWNGCECERDGTRIRMSKYDKRKTSSHMHTNWDQCPQKAITVSLCDYLRHYTVLYWTMAVWTHTYNRISAESMTKCKRRSLQKREDQVRFQNRKSNCAIFVILAFKSIECFFSICISHLVLSFVLHFGCSNRGRNDLQDVYSFTFYAYH